MSQIQEWGFGKFFTQDHWQSELPLASSVGVRSQSMKSMFRGYYPPSKEEFRELWTEGTIVLDTNALLHFFRYSAATRDELMDLLKKEQARLWLPHQVGAEFHRNRRWIPGQQQQAFSDVETALSKSRNGIQSAIDALGRNATQEAKDLSSLLKKHDSKLRKELKRARRRHADAVTSPEAQATTFQAITELYDGRVGRGYETEELEKLFKEGAARYAKELPPGFADAKNKEGDRKYGDLIVWRQILDYAATERKPMLFITDDGKEDWWDKANGETIGPRPELVEEYYEASGRRVHFYSVRRFLAHAKQQGEKISESSVEEARQVSSLEFKVNTARNAALRRVFERMNQVDYNGADFDATVSNVERMLPGLSTQQPVIRNPKVDEWVQATLEANTNNAMLDPLSERLRNSYTELKTESYFFDAARQIQDREKQTTDILRKLGILDGANIPVDGDELNDSKPDY